MPKIYDPFNKKIVDKFWSLVNKNGPIHPIHGQCWEWMAGKSEGYGKISIGYKKHQVFAHRYSWSLHFGEIPISKFVCHKCDNRRCVNPNHLFIGTDSDNMSDMISKGRDRKALGPSNGRAKLKESLILEIRKLCRSKRLSRRSVAKLFGISHTVINDIMNGRTWRHVNAKV